MFSRFKRLSPLVALMILTAALAACAPTAPGQPTQAPAANPAPTQAPAATEVVTEAATQAPAPTDAPTTAPAVTEAAAPAAVSFAKDVQPILEQSCVKCHGGSDGKKGGLSLKTYDDLMQGGENGKIVTPGDAANSSLVEAIASGKMPKRASKLAQSAIDTISAWVAAGAPNN